MADHRAADLAALRARLYRPDADADDVARYEAALALQAPSARPTPVAEAETTGAEDAPPAVQADVAAPVPARVWPRRLLLVGGLAAAGAGALALSSRRTAPQAAPSASVFSSDFASLTRPTVLPVSTADRQGFVRALRSGAPAGLTRWLLDSWGSDVVVSEYHGRGSGGDELLAPVADTTVRRVRVVAVLDADADLEWAVSRLVIDTNRSVMLSRIAIRGGRQAAGVPTSADFVYGQVGRPIRLSVATTPGTRWGIALLYR